MDFTDASNTDFHRYCLINLDLCIIFCIKLKQVLKNELNFINFSKLKLGFKPKFSFPFKRKNKVQKMNFEEIQVLKSE